jgi:uncharacterized protein
MCNLTRRTRLLPLVLLGALSGCASLGRDSPPLQQYVLGGLPLPAEARADAGARGDTSAVATASAPASAARVGAGLTVGMRRTEVAAYLASPAIVVRRGANEIMVSDFHRWGEDVAEGVSRAVALHLAAGAAVDAVSVAPWPARSRHDYLVQLRISRFEGVTPREPSERPGAVHVLASWEVLRQLDGAVLAQGTTDYRDSSWTVGDYAALVTRLDTGLLAVARDIHAAIAGLTPDAQPLHRERGSGGAAAAF